MKKVFVKTLILMTLMLVGVSTSAEAKVNSILVKDTTTSKYYEYSLYNLISESQNSIIGLNAPLFDEYSSNSQNVAAFHDSNKGYVKFNIVISAAQLAALDGKGFDIDEFVANLQDSNAFLSPSTNVQERKTQDGKVVDGQINPNDNYFELDAIE